MKNKTVKIEVRLTPTEKEKIRELSELTNVTMAEFIRRTCLKKSPNFLSKSEQIELNDLRKKVFQLIQIGNLYHEQKTAEFKSLVEQSKSFYQKIIKRK